jgi:predicted negative regulator of RcsB-dependent stress response
MKTIAISIFVILLVYSIVNYKLYDFNKRETVYSVEYRPIPYSAHDMLNENNINSQVNTFKSDIYAQFYEPEE